jgi:ribonuclease-3
VFLDGGYPAARESVLAVLGRHIERLDPERPAKDAKTQLQEVLQAARKPLPEYRVVEVQGAPHRQSFEVECVIAGGITARGTGSSRQRAEQQAAAAMLEKLA